MADNDILVDGKAVATKDRSNVRWQQFLEGNSVTATVIVATVGTSSATPAVPADTTTRRVLSIKNTGASVVELSPVQNFAYGAGMPLNANESLSCNYNGAIYARVAGGTGEIRAWSEA